MMKLRGTVRNPGLRRGYAGVDGTAWAVTFGGIGADFCSISAFRSAFFCDFGDAGLAVGDAGLAAGTAPQHSVWSPRSPEWQVDRSASSFLRVPKEH